MQPTMQKNNVKQRKTIAIIAMIQRHLRVECEGARHASGEL